MCVVIMANFAQITWILVANRARAMIFSSCGQECPMTVMERIENPWRDLQDARSSDDQVERSFGLQLAELLDQKRSEGAFHRLILIAEPKLLSVLSAQISPSTQHLVQVVSNKELMRPTQESLRSHLAGFARV
jgi:protein required for attachment to host cells